MAALGRLAIAVEADIADFTSDMGKAERVAKRTADQIDRSLTRAFKAIGVGAGAAALALGAAVRSSINAADEMGKMAQKVGVSVEALSGLKFAAEQSGIAFEKLQGGLVKLARSAADAAGGLKQQQAVFQAIGVSVTDASGKLRATEAIFGDVAEAMSRMEDSAAKTALATRIFGRAGADLLPMLNAGRSGLAAYAREAEQLGLIMSTSAAKGAEQFNDNLDKVRQGVGAVGYALAEQLLPALVSATDSMVAWVKQLRESGAIDRFVAGIRSLISVLDDLAVFIMAKLVTGALIALAGSLLKLKETFGAVRTAATLMAGAQAALLGPIGLVTGAVALLVAGIYHLLTAETETARVTKIFAEATATAANAADAMAGATREQIQTQMAGLEATRGMIQQQLDLAEANLTVAASEAEITRQRMQAVDPFATYGGGAPIQDTGGNIAGVTAEVERLRGALFQTDETWRRLQAALSERPDQRTGAPLVDLTDAAGKAREELAKLMDEAEKFGAQTIAGLVRRFNPLLAVTLEYEDTLGRLARLADGNTEQQRLYAEAIQYVERARREDIDAIQRQQQELAREQDVIARLNEEYAEQIEKLGMTERELYLYEAAQQAVNQAQAAFANGVQPVPGYLDKVAESARRNAAQLYDTEEAIESNRAAVQSWAQFWQSGVQSVADIIGQFATRQIQTFNDLGKALIDTAKRMIAQILAEFAKLALVKFFTGQGGSWGQIATGLMASIGGGATAAMAGGMGGGGGGSGYGGLSSMVSAGRMLAGNGMQGFMANNPWIGTAAPYIGGAAGAAYGITQRGGSNFSGGSLAAGASYGALGYSAATVGVAAAGGGLAAGGAAAMAIPVVGWVLAIMALIDLVSGGKLFGTRFKPESISQSIGIDQDGGYASASMREVRNRSLFRGRQWRNTDIDPSDEAVRASQKLWDTIEKVMIRGAKQLQTTMPPIIEGAFTVMQEFDKKGKPKGDPTEYFTILGQKFDEGYEEFVKRLSGFNLMSVIANALTVDQITGGMSGAGGLGDPGGVGGPGGGFNPDRPGTMPTAMINLAEAISGATADGSRQIEEQTHSWQASFDALMGIASRWEGSADEFLAGVNLMLVAASDMVRGNGLLGAAGTLEDIVDLVEDYRGENETLVDTYGRIVVSVRMFEQALDLAGISLKMTGETFVRFATDITEAAGGLENAQALWNRFFTGFYDASLLAANQFEQLTEQVTDMLEAVGYVGKPMDTEAFRQQFEDLLPTLSPEEVVAWLQAGDAMLTMVEMARQLAATEAGIAAANMQLSEFLGALANDGWSEPVQALMNLNNQYQQHVQTIHELARATGRAEASQLELGFATQWYQRQLRALASEMREAALGIAAQLGYIGQQEAGGGMYGTELGGIREVEAAVEDRYARELQLLAQLDQYVRSLGISALSPLTPSERLGEAEAEYLRLLGLAQGGDLEALEQLQAAANAYLQEAQSYYGGVGAYQGIFDAVRGALGGLVDRGPLSTPTEPTPVYGGPVTVEPGAGWAEQNAIERALLAQQLVDYIGALALAMGQTSLQIMEELGIPLEQLVTDLGINLQNISGAAVEALAQLAMDLGLPLGELVTALGLELPDLAAGVRELAASLGIDLTAMTAATATSLAQLATSLGVDLLDLTTALGIDLGALTDANSPIFLALTDLIDQLSPEIRDELEDLLAAIADATTEADANAAVNAASAYINSLPAGIRNALAPYFADVFPAGALNDLDYLEAIDTTAVSIDTELRLANVKFDDMVGHLANIADSVSSDAPDMVSALMTTDLLAANDDKIDAMDELGRRIDSLAARIEPHLASIARTNSDQLQQMKRPQAAGRAG